MKKDFKKWLDDFVEKKQILRNCVLIARHNGNNFPFIVQDVLNYIIIFQDVFGTIVKDFLTRNESDKSEILTFFQTIVEHVLQVEGEGLGTVQAILLNLEKTTW